MSLSKLRSKYGAPAAGDPRTEEHWRGYLADCRRAGDRPMDRARFDGIWLELAAGHQALQRLGELMRQHRGQFLVLRDDQDNLVVRIRETWGRRHGALAWEMWELFELAAPLIRLCWMDRLPRLVPEDVAGPSQVPLLQGS